MILDLMSYEKVVICGMSVFNTTKVILRFPSLYNYTVSQKTHQL